MQNVDQVIADISAKTEQKVIDGFRTGELTWPSSVGPLHANLPPLVVPIVLATASSAEPEIAKQNKDALQKSTDTLMGFMQAGNKEFEERTGRPMTYAEMRSMYG